MTAPRFAYAGSPQFSATILQALLDAGWRPTLVITEPPKPVGRNHVVTATAVGQLAEQAGLPFATPHDKLELVSSLSQLRPLDLLLVAAYGKILPAEALTLPAQGAINVHASLLPKYRGASPIQAAILAGDQQTGITFMAMEPSLDTGPILAFAPVTIEPTDTTATLTERLADCAAGTLVQVVKDYLSGILEPVDQDHDQASYAPKLSSDEGKISLGAADPVQLDRMVRALNPWPGVYTDDLAIGPEPNRRGIRLKILDGTLDGERYTITQIQWAGKTPVDGSTFARAYPDVLTELPPSITLGASFTE